jgi:hypothetical protein
MRKIVLLSALLSLLSLMSASAFTPKPIQRTACSVSMNCICGGGTVTISCSGNVSCHEAARSVTCDGETERCPPITSCPH